MLAYIIGSKDQDRFAFIDHFIKDNKINILKVEDTTAEYASEFEDEQTARAIIKILIKHIDQFDDKEYILNLRVFSYEKIVKIKEI